MPGVILHLLRAADAGIRGLKRLSWLYCAQDTGMEVLKQARFGRSHSLLRWGHHIALLGLLPAYYWHRQGDLLLGLFFLCNAATIPRQLRW